MTADLAELVHPVFHRALVLRERLESGDDVRLEVEQAAFREMLLTDVEASRVPEFGGTARTGRLGGPFQGIRYGLVCWLDEFFTHTCWAEKWRERTLEAALYGTGDGPSRFWEQAHLVEKQPGTDALEGYFLCVVLGFRGARGHMAEQVQQWMTKVQDQLTGAGRVQWRGPGELEPVRNGARLRARGHWYSCVLAAALTVLAAIPAATFFFVRKLGL